MGVLSFNFQGVISLKFKAKKKETTVFLWFLFYVECNLEVFCFLTDFGLSFQSQSQSQFSVSVLSLSSQSQYSVSVFSPGFQYSVSVLL